MPDGHLVDTVKRLVGQLTIAEISMSQHCTGLRSASHMPVGQMTNGQMSDDQMSASQMSASQMSVGQMSVGPTLHWP
jgi:hypothetical protein